MSAYGLVEFLVIGGALLLSAWSVLGQFAPRLRARLLSALTGQRPAATAKAAGCDTGCSSCNGCATTKPATEQPIRFVGRQS
ncbi:MAG TPA: hypothetical protein VLI06_09205 [Solimonas sp.]|nr:hypothetical protein [Solimonas sp.]